jgi:colanic acid/amylovoran biosynthesis glycosyltransferase
MQTPPVIAHINYHFFKRTETFIYFYLSKFQRTHPICVSWASPLVNIDSFPFPPEDCYSYADTPVQRCRPHWLATPALQRAKRWLRPPRWRPPVYRTHWSADILRKRNARLIHAHFGTIGWQVLALKRALSLPLITTFYGFDVMPTIAAEGTNWPQRRQELFTKGDLFLVEGPFMRQRLMDLGCPPGKIQIQRIAVPVDQIPFRPRQARRGEKPILMFAGGFFEKKGLLEALQATGALRKEGYDFEFRIIGDGELAPRVKELIRELDLNTCVRLLGFLNHQDYLREMERADVFVHPSVVTADGDSEGGAPTVILEAQAMGLPVVSTFHADIPNVTVPGESALLVPERDIAALTRALQELLEHPERWEPMGRAGRAQIERLHNINTEVHTLEDRYLGLIGPLGQQ